MKSAIEILKEIKEFDNKVKTETGILILPEKIRADIQQLLESAPNSKYMSPTAQLKQFHEKILEQKDLDPEIQALVNDNFWDLF